MWALSPNGVDRQLAFENFNAQLQENLQIYLPDMEKIAQSMVDMKYVIRVDFIVSFQFRGLCFRENAARVEEQLHENFNLARAVSVSCFAERSIHRSLLSALQVLKFAQDLANLSTKWLVLEN